MNRRGFIGILGGVIAGAAVDYKAFASEYAPAVEVALVDASGFNLADCYERIAHEALDILHKSVQNQKRFAITSDIWKRARIGQHIRTVDAEESGAGPENLVVLNRVATAQVNYSYCDLLSKGEARQQFIAKQLAPKLAAMASDIDFWANGMEVVSAPLELPHGVEAALAITAHGLSARMVCCYNIMDDRMLMRFDSLLGFK